MDQIGGMEIYWFWLIIAALLAAGELLVVPGIYLIFIAAAAFGVGILTSVLPLSMTVQLLIFGMLSIASVYLGKNWYRRSDVTNSDPMLNDRSARMIGQSVTITEAISTDSGRAKVGDSEWPARGPDMAVGAKARIAYVENGVLQLEPVE